MNGPIPKSPARTPSTLAFMLRAFRARNYRLFFAGQLISLIGTWLTTVATSWLVYRLTHDTVTLGMVGFAGQIPAFFCAPLAGVLIDRWNLHRVLVLTQTLSMLQSAALAILTLTHTISVPWVFALFAFQGLVNALDMPARQAFVVQMVDDPHDLPNAIALNSSMFNTARLLGPALAGVLIAAFGEGLCFSLDAVSYLAVIAGLLLMRLPPRLPRANAKHVFSELHEGIRYAFGTPPIRAILLLLALVSLVGVPYTVLLPVFAKDILHGDPKTLGFLSAASGLGALAGALRLAARKSVLGLGRVIPAAAAGFGGAIIAFAYSRYLPLSMACLAVAGFCMVSQMASGNTLLQTIVEPDKRGRVMALFAMAFAGMMPFGSLLVGTLARNDRLGPSLTVALGGGCTMLAASAFALYLPQLRAHIRPIYIQRGILPPIATGLQAATNAVEACEN
jgi:MFS family permease